MRSFKLFISNNAGFKKGNNIILDVQIEALLFLYVDLQKKRNLSSTDMIYSLYENMLQTQSMTALFENNNVRKFNTGKSKIN